MNTLHLVEKLGGRLVDKIQKANQDTRLTPYVSPYLKAPLRSLEEVLKERDRLSRKAAADRFVGEPPRRPLQSGRGRKTG